MKVECRTAIAVLTLLATIAASSAAVACNEPAGLVGRWEFDDSACKDLSGNGNDAVLNGTRIYPLGESRACIELMPEPGPVKIPVSENSPLAISRGTICFWLNVGWTHSNILSYNNGAVQLNVYRGDFQVRFGGEDDGDIIHLLNTTTSSGDPNNEKLYHVLFKLPE